MTEHGREARALAERIVKMVMYETDDCALDASDMPDVEAIIPLLITALQAAQAATWKEAEQVVNGLMGKDSGNWNRAIIYAVEAMKKAHQMEAREP